MITLRRRRGRHEPSYPEDVERIVGALLEFGYHASHEDAEWAWDQHSDSRDAGWLMLPMDPQDIVETVLAWLEPL